MALLAMWPDWPFSKDLSRATATTAAWKRQAVVGAVSGCPVVNLDIAGFSVGALVDTGAACTLLRLDMFNKIAEKEHRFKYLRAAPALRGVSGEALDVRGCTEIKIKGVKEQVVVTVLADLPCKIVLGEDALREGHAVIDLSRNRLRWHQKIWKIISKASVYAAGLGQILPETGSKKINKLVSKNADLFSAKGESNGFCDLIPFQIKTNHAPISQPAYRTPLAKRKIVADAIDEMLEEVVIRPSHSPWASPVTLVPKKDGTTRFCVDYPKLLLLLIRTSTLCRKYKTFSIRLGGVKFSVH